MTTLAEKIRASRMLTIEIGHMRFFARRPSIEEFGAIYQDGTKDPDMARRFVTGWEGVRECDLLRGGSEELVPFDADLWREAVADLPGVWRDICAALVKATRDHWDAVDINRKN